MKFRATSLSILATLSMAGAISGSLIACGGGDDDGNTDVVAEGDHYHYVVDTVTVPQTQAQQSMYGLDLNGDGSVNNQLGAVLSTLAGQGINAQESLTASVNDGTIILLGDVQTSAFTSATGAGFKVYLGDNPTPAPCTDVANPATCGKHLDGSGSFDISSTSSTDGGVVGNFVNGTFNGGPGKISLQIALQAGSPIDIDLVGARSKLTGVSATGITSGIIAGGILKTDIDTKILPAVAGFITPLLAECDGTGTTPDACGCGEEQDSARTVLALLDANNDCEITLTEIQTNGLISSLLAPDVDLDGDGTFESVSMGVGMSAVAATYDQP